MGSRIDACRERIVRAGVGRLRAVAEAGTGTFAAGSARFGQPDDAAVIRRLRDGIGSARC